MGHAFDDPAARVATPPAGHHPPILAGDELLHRQWTGHGQFTLQRQIWDIDHLLPELVEPLLQNPPQRCLRHRELLGATRLEPGRVDLHIALADEMHPLR